jgi:branched-subunit amino acid ABC-type transport system permease component
MHLALTEVQAGLAVAAVYAILAVSLTFTYRVTRIVLLAQGDVMLCGSYASYFVAEHNNNVALALLTGFVASAVVSTLCYLLIFRWLLSVQSHLATLVAGLAIATGIEEFLRIEFFHGQSAAYPMLSIVGSMSTTSLDLSVIGLAIVVGIVFELIMRTTRTGRQLRAVADNVEVARLLGVRAERMRILTFALAGGLGGLAGVLSSVIYQSISFTGGQTLEFAAIACILLGGLGSVAGALIGAVVLGVGQTLVSTYVSSSYATALVFAIVLLIIAFRPSGILGVTQAERA